MPEITEPNAKASTLIAPGDAGLLIKTDGSIQVFNAFDLSDPSQITEAQMETHEKLQALAVALRIPKIMSVLQTMANDTTIRGVLNEPAPN